MRSVWRCPDGHLMSFRLTEYSPDINFVRFDDEPCEECGVEFDDGLWKFIDMEDDDAEC